MDHEPQAYERGEDGGCAGFGEDGGVVFEGLGEVGEGGEEWACGEKAEGGVVSEQYDMEMGRGGGLTFPGGAPQEDGGRNHGEFQPVAYTSLALSGIVYLPIVQLSRSCCDADSK